MADKLAGDTLLALTQEELSSVDKYRRIKETSVLTIMFTDIKDFTLLNEEKGEMAAARVRQCHDKILMETIQENQGGLVIKHIGDAVMAVFSEPSTAVARALKIQERIRAWNETQADMDPIQVRIGLHMGQVAVENDIQLDLFGRHVNRASRVEGLADGGQIYLTYPVFDSARSWLGDKINRKLTWTMHGKYYLKGIPTPVEIYEVVDAEHGKPKPPAKGKKRSAWPPLWIGLGLVVLGISIPLAIMQFKKTKVFFVKFYAEEIWLDQKEKIVLDGDKALDARRVLNPVPIGRYVLHYDVNYLSKYAMEFEAQRGENYIHPKFVEFRLPSFSKRIEVESNATSAVARVSEDVIYPLYNALNQKLEHRAQILLTVEGKKANARSDQVVFNFVWKLVLDGKDAGANQRRVENSLSNDESIRDEFTLYTDSEHFYTARYFINRSAAEIELDGVYSEYKKK